MKGCRERDVGSFRGRGGKRGQKEGKKGPLGATGIQVYTVVLQGGNLKKMRRETKRMGSEGFSSFEGN